MSVFRRLLLICIAAFLTISPGYAQNNADDFRPQVIDVQPLPGAEIAEHDPLIVTFNQAMRQNNTRLSFAPALTGQIEWLDHRTLAFTPQNEAWPRSRQYSVTVEGTAENGLTLDSYTFDMQTPRSLTVIHVTPADGTDNVAGYWSTITVTFDRPVVTLTPTTEQGTLPQPLNFLPRLPGTGQWVNTSTYEYTPMQYYLSKARQYTVTVEAGLGAVDGTALEMPYAWTFRTLTPQALTIEANYFDGGPPWGLRTALIDSGFEVVFSDPLDKATVENAFSLRLQKEVYFGDGFNAYPDEGIPIDGTFAWNANGTRMTFQPSERLQYNTYYRVVLEPTVQTEVGAGIMDQPLESLFLTIPTPGVLETRPRHGANIQPGYQFVNFSFLSPMNMESLRNHYRVEPEPLSAITPYVHEDGTFTLKFKHELGQTYTVTLLPGIEDIYGTPMKQPYAFSYHVREETRPNQVWLGLNSEFSLLREGQPDPVFPLKLQGSPSVRVDVYTTDMKTILDLNYTNWDHQKEWLSQVNSLYYYSEWTGMTHDIRERDIPWVTPETHIYSASQSFNGLTELHATTMALSNGEPLSPGIYGVEVHSLAAFQPNYPVNRDKTGFVMAVTNAAITIRSTPDSWQAWVTDMDTGEPLPGQLVRLYTSGDTVLFSMTDADGVAHWPLGALKAGEHAFVVVENEDVFGIWQGTTSRQIGVKTVNHLYTDRPIYRPGETVYFRGMLRDKDDVTYTVPMAETLYATVALSYYFSYEPTYLYREQLILSDFGTFSGEVQLPADLLPGYYTVGISNCAPGDYECPRTYYASINFSVAEYRVPEYEVKVVPQRDQIVSGDPLDVMVETTYYFGEPLSDASVTWEVNGGGFGYWNPGQEYARYRFYDVVSLSDEHSSYYETTGRTDAQGRFLINSPYIHGESRPMQAQIRATITDESGQAITNRSYVTVHPANLYVGLRPQQTRAEVGQPIDVDLVTLDAQSELRPTQTILLTVHEIRWNRQEVEFGRYTWNREEILVTEARMMTGADGKNVYRFTPPGSGQYRIRARGGDENGRLAGSSTYVYVRDLERSDDDTPASRWFGDPYVYPAGCVVAETRTLRLIPDQESYAPGDTAAIFIPNPFGVPVTAMIAVERHDIMAQEVVRIEGDALTYMLPITEDHAPNVHFKVLLIHGIGEQQPNPGYVHGSISLAVAPTHRRLNIAITPSAEVAAPGDTVSFDLTVTDHLGNPVSAELGVSLVDEAVLALADRRLKTLEGQYYSPNEQSRVSTSSAITALLTTPLVEYTSPCGYGGGGSGENFLTSRGDYQTTPLWEPHVVTDQDGRASVSVVMPSNLTRWQFDAYATTSDTKVGQAQTSITSTLPLAVRPTTPRFLVAGDRLPLSAIVHNNTDAPQMVDVTLTVEGATVMQPENLTQTVEIPPKRRAVVAWPVSVDDTPYVDVTVSAEARSGLRDAAKPPLGLIPVMRYTARDTMATGGILTEAGTITEGVSIPPRLGEATGTLTVDLDASLLTSIADGLRALWERRAEGDNLELVVSHLYPELVLYNAQRRLGLAVEGKEQFTAALDDALKRLEREQLPDGGWGWWSQTQSDPNVTAYVLLGLSEALDAHFTVDSDMLGAALDYLRGQIITPKIDTPPRELDRQAFFLYVLARHEAITEAQLNALFDHRLEMSWAARAYLLMAYPFIAPDSVAINTLLSDLTSAAVFTATGAHWEESGESGWYNWGSDTRTTAVVLAAIIQTKPENILPPHAVRWLVATRRGDLWRTAQESAWALVALTEWMAYTSELDGDYTYTASVNGDMRLAVDVTPETVGEGETFAVPVAELLDREINRLDITRGDGAGALYYSALLDLHLPADQVEAVSRGVTVTRQYIVDSARDGRTSAQVGDVVTVRLSLYASQNIHYFALEDTLPAGLEVINSTLLTEDQSQVYPHLVRIDRKDRYWYYGDSYFTRTAIRDEGVALYAAYLPRGGYVYTYQARAVTPGEFQAIPTQGYAVYQPDVFGRSAGTIFTVTPKER